MLAKVAVSLNICFNSNMVRLKELTTFYVTTPMTFQFQYGAIKGAAAGTHRGDEHPFQFQYGAIKGQNRQDS